MAQVIAINTQTFQDKYSDMKYDDGEVETKGARACTQITRLIAHSTIRWADKMANDELTTDQLANLVEAAELQLYYVFSSGDFSSMSGYDANTHAVINVAGLVIAREAYDLLVNKGFMYRGLR